MLTKQPTTSDAIVASDEARIIVVYAENIDSMLEDDPKIAMQLLRQMAGRIQTNFS
jgi:membrane protein